MNCLVTETRYAATCPVTLDQASEHTEQTWQLKHQKEKDVPPAKQHQLPHPKEGTGGYMGLIQTPPFPPNSQQSDAHSPSNHEQRTPSPSVTGEMHGIILMDKSLKGQQPQFPGQGIGFAMKARWSQLRTLPGSGLKSRKK